MNVFLDADNARQRMAYAWKLATALLASGNRVKITVNEYHPKRSEDQSARFHAICGEIAKSMKWAGKKRDGEAWKRLLVDAWARVEGRQQGDIVPSLDGQSVVSLGIQTRSMPVADMSGLIEFAQSWCVDNDVQLSH